MNNIVGSIPEFTSDDTGATGTEVVGQPTQAPGEEQGEEGKDTQPQPPGGDQPDGQPVVDSSALEKQNKGLEGEKERLLADIRDLRGTRRVVREALEGEQSPPSQPQPAPDVLKDIHPDDVALIDKVLRTKGYVTKEEASSMFYKSVEKEEISKFLLTHPEYREENDPNDVNWNALKREWSYFDPALRSDPKLIGDLLLRAHQSLARGTTDRTITAKKQQVAVASVGGSGVQRSSPSAKTLSPQYRQVLERGGWSEDEIQNIEKNLK